jgi:hypothetical protein
MQRRNKVNIKPKAGTGISKLPITITIIQTLLATNLIISAILIVTHSFYPTLTLGVGVTISYATSVFFMLLLTIRFAKWFRSRRNIELLLYGISAASIIISGVTILLFSDITISSLPSNVRFRIGGSSIYIAPNSPEEKLAELNYFFGPITFFLTWLATATLLRGYGRKHGNFRYWTIISIPLLVFMSQYIIQILRVSDQLIATDPVFYGSLFTLLFIFTKLAGGILFGLAFWLISRKIETGKSVREFLVMSAYGLVLLLLSIQILGIIVVPYPPFGILTISIVGLSSYLVFMGIYGSAITLTESSKLRLEIRKKVTESGFLDSIGSAQLENRIEKEVAFISKNFQDKLLKETGMRLDMEKEEVNDYIKEVLAEIKRNKT